MTDLELYDKITEAGLTPNQYFAVLFHLLNVSKKCNFNTAAHLSQLTREGFLTKDKKPTKKLLDTGLFGDLELKLVEDDDGEKNFDNKVRTYINFFPNGRLPSGAFAKAAVPAVKIKFREFFDQYNYDWDTIFQATENYINHYAQDGYKWMRNCLNFIMKEGESQLALECDAIINKSEIRTVNPFSLDI